MERDRKLKRGLLALWGWALMFPLILVLIQPEGENEIGAVLAFLLITFPAAVAGVWIYLQDMQRCLPKGTGRGAWQAAILYSGPVAAAAYWLTHRDRVDSPA